AIGAGNASPLGTGNTSGGGTSTKGGSTSGTGTSSCSGPKSTITIGTVGTQSGVVGTYFASGVQGVQTWVSAINAAGGLNCHPVKFLVADDGGDPSRNQALVQQFVERDRVLA